MSGAALAAAGSASARPPVRGRPAAVRAPVRCPRPAAQGSSLLPYLSLNLARLRQSRLASRRASHLATAAKQTSTTTAEPATVKAELVEGTDDYWLVSALVLVLGGLLPSLFAGYYAPELIQAANGQTAYVAAGIVGTDVLFALTAHAFLTLGGEFGQQRYAGQQIPFYPGPWYEAPGVRRVPRFFFQYVKALPLTVGVIAPLAASGYGTWRGHGWLVAATLVPYLMTTFVQIYEEYAFPKQQPQSSAMWPMIPVVHMLYRLWQLPRGCWLVRTLGGPAWLAWLQLACLGLWVFNFGAVMAWMPWMYRWQFQPEIPTGQKDE